MNYFKGRAEKKNKQRELEIAKMENQIAKTKTNTMALEMQRETMEQFRNSGYSHGGASRSATWQKGYNSESLSPKSDIEENRKTLRERSRDLAMNAPIATAAVNSTRTSCVGSGLIPKPKIDNEFLGISKEEKERLEKKIEKEFALWAESTLCDTQDQNNFYELQQIAFNDWLKNGEEFALIRYDSETSQMPYQIRIKLIQADRVSTPNSFDGDYDGIDKMLKNGNRIMNGIEINPDGKVTAYYISSHFPGEDYTESQKWSRVAKRGEKTGNPNILHIFNADTAEQYRGVPFLAPVIQTVKQVTRYTEAEIMAAVVNALFAIFITTKDGDDLTGFEGEDQEEMKGPEPKDNGIKVGSGTVTFLKEGETVQAVESKHPSGSFDSFMMAMATQIGAALDLAPEVLLKKFGQNFSASKGALNETWRSFKMRRKWFVSDFCQEVYELWFCEAVSKGRINAPGFFTDPLVRRAYTNASWTGPAQGCLNPVQEVNAAVSRIKEGLSTHEDECVAMNGSSFDDNVRTLLSENERLAEADRAREVQQIMEGE